MKTTPWVRGTLIAKDGVYSGLPMDLYHGSCTVAPSISSSGLRTIWDKSLAHYFCESYLNPEAEPRKESEAFVFGRAAHHLLLGEDQFATKFIVRPAELEGEPWNSNRTACKRWLFKQREAARTVLLDSDIKIIRGMVKSLGKHPLIKAGILNGEVERSLIAKDKETGVYLKSRPDVIPMDSGDFADLKTCTSVDYDDLARSIAEFGYHQQGALVGETYKAITGREMTSFTLVFVEKKPPYCVRIVTLKPTDLDLGARQNRAALRMFAEALKTGEWQGYEDQDSEFIELPKWYQDRADHRLEFINKVKEKPQAADTLGAG